MLIGRYAARVSDTQIEKVLGISHSTFKRELAQAEMYVLGGSWVKIGVGGLNNVICITTLIQ